jgi:hypothetical protein
MVRHGSFEEDFPDILEKTPFLGIRVDDGQVWKAKGASGICV